MGSEKFRNLVLEQPPLPGSPEEQLERDYRAWSAKVRGPGGKVPGREFYDDAEGKSNPLRVFSRRVQKADRARVPPEQIEELHEIIARYVQARLASRQSRRPSRGAA